VTGNVSNINEIRECRQWNGCSLLHLYIRNEVGTEERLCGITSPFIF
jgi:hypothetical protein